MHEHCGSPREGYDFYMYNHAKYRRTLPYLLSPLIDATLLSHTSYRVNNSKINRHGNQVDVFLLKPISLGHRSQRLSNSRHMTSKAFLGIQIKPLEPDENTETYHRPYKHLLQNKLLLLLLFRVRKTRETPNNKQAVHACCVSQLITKLI